MKKHCILLLVLSFFIFLSCKKKDETKIETPATGGSSTYKIKTVKSYYIGGDTSLIEYFYDTAGRLSKTKSSDGSSVMTSWTSSQVVYTLFSSSNAVIGKITYYLNSSGQAVNAAGSFNASSISAVFKYNTDGYLTNNMFVDDSDTTTTAYTITDGNATGSVAKLSYSPSQNNTSVTDFYTDKANTIGTLNTGFNITGKQNKNLEKSVTTVSQSGTTVINNTYELDSKGRVTKKTSDTGTSTTVTLYTYY